MTDAADDFAEGVVRRKGEVWHRDRDCVPGSRMEELTPEEAREEGYTPCLECCPEGWPDVE